MIKYKVKEYIDFLKEENQVIEIINCEDILDTTVEYMSYNSKDIKKNTLFICKGETFKEEYLKSAARDGVMIYVSEKKYDIDIPCIIVKNMRICLSLLATKYFNNPSSKLNIIGITGTKGKSTTAYFVKYILDEYAKANNLKDTAIISSIFTYDGKDTYKSKLTTPESFDLQRNLYNAVESGIKNVVMEVSSQALKYGRVYNVNFNIAAFLNISEDHIGPKEHKDFEDYFSSKLKIFEKTNIACINLDSEYSKRIYDKAKSDSNKVITYSSKNKDADVFASNIHKEGLSTVFSLTTNKDNFEIKLTMPGLFNVENALAAISIAKIMNIPQRYIYIGLLNARSEGRMEIYKSSDEKILTIVDYAHNKISFEKIFETTKKEYPDRKIIVVFGCPGNKAQIRRRDLGKITGKSADYIYITEDDPAFETVDKISKEIVEFVKEYTDNYEIVEERKDAIYKAIDKIKKSGEKYILLLLGKGNEMTQKVGSDYVPYLGDSNIIKTLIENYEKEYLK